MNRREWWNRLLSISAAVATGSGLRAVSLAGPPQAHFHHRQKTLTRCGIPCHAYGKDSEAARGIALASADEPPRTVKGLEGLPQRPIGRVDTRATELEEIPTPPLTRIDASALSDSVSRKAFHVHATAITAAATSLQQMAISLYSSGQLQTSGRLVHTGGPDGGLLGNNVSIRLRAYAAPAVPNPQVLPIDAVMVWEAEPEHKLWVARNQPVVVTLTAHKQVRDRELRRFFNEITHFEVELVTLHYR